MEELLGVHVAGRNKVVYKTDLSAYGMCQLEEGGTLVECRWFAWKNVLTESADGQESC